MAPECNAHLCYMYKKSKMKTKQNENKNKKRKKKQKKKKRQFSANEETQPAACDGGIPLDQHFQRGIMTHSLRFFLYLTFLAKRL